MEISRENFHAWKHDEAPSNRTDCHWFAEFQRGRTFVSDEFREGRPSTSIVATNADAVREMIERDRHITYREIQAFLGIFWHESNTYDFIWSLERTETLQSMDPTQFDRSSKTGSC